MPSMSRIPSVFKSPASREVYARLLGGTKKLGKFEVEEKKTCVHWSRGRAFAGVHPRATGIVLSLVFDTPLKSARVRKSEKLSANRYHAELLIEDPEEVDAQLLGWMEKAYALTE